MHISFRGSKVLTEKLWANLRVESKVDILHLLDFHKNVFCITDWHKPLQILDSRAPTTSFALQSVI